MEKITVFCIFPDIYDFFNLMALQLFFPKRNSDQRIHIDRIK